MYMRYTQLTTAEPGCHQRAVAIKGYPFETYLKLKSQKTLFVHELQPHYTNVWNWPHSQTPECTCSISHNATSRTEMCTFLFWMLHCGIWNRCILGFVKLVYCTGLGSFSAMLHAKFQDDRVPERDVIDQRYVILLSMPECQIKRGPWGHGNKHLNSS